MLIILVETVVLAVVAAFLHGSWEYLHLPLYRGYEALGQGWEVISYATVGDVFYTLVVYSIFVLFRRKPKLWELAVVGFLLALMVEYKAQLLGRWAYAPEMPMLGMFGLSPLLQMTILLPLSFYLMYFITRRMIQSAPFRKRNGA